MRVKLFPAAWSPRAEADWLLDGQHDAGARSGWTLFHRLNAPLGSRHLPFGR